MVVRTSSTRGRINVHLCSQQRDTRCCGVGLQGPSVSRLGIIRKGVQEVLLLGKSLGCKEPLTRLGIDCDQAALHTK
jgi:hypothetical protein